MQKVLLKGNFESLVQKFESLLKLDLEFELVVEKPIKQPAIESPTVDKGDAALQQSDATNFKSTTLL